MERTIFGIAELLHQFVADLGILREAEAFLLGAFRKAVIGDGGSDDVKGGGFGIVSAQEGEELDDFDEASRP